MAFVSLLRPLAYANKPYLSLMFWSENELDREELIQRFEAENAAGTLGYYSWAALEELFLEYIETGERAMAERVLSHAQYLYEGNPRLYYLYSHLALEKDNLIEARAYIQKAFQFMAPDRALYEQYIYILVQLRQYEEAYWLLEAYEEDFPEAAGEVWRYGIALLEVHKAWSQIRRIAWRGIEKAPSHDTYFWWKLLRSYEHAGEISQGIQDFWTATWSRPADYRFWIGLAYLYERKLAYQQALSALREAEALLSFEEEASDSWWTLQYYVAARVYESMGLWEEAFRAYLQVRHYRPRLVSALVGIIRYYHRQERWSEAEPHLRKAIRIAGRRPVVQALAAEHLWAQGDWNLAAQLYEALLTHEPHAEKAVERLLLHYAEQEDRKAFRRVLIKAAKVFPQKPNLWLKWSLQAHARNQVLYAWYIVDHAMSRIEKRYLPAALYFWHAGLAWNLGHRARALHSLEQGLLRDATQVHYLKKALPDSEIPLPLKHLLRRYQQLT